jgi:hypothetical protein
VPAESETSEESEGPELVEAERHHTHDHLSGSEGNAIASADLRLL